MIFLKSWKASSFHFFYPSICLHCHKKIGEASLVCLECTPFFELIDYEERCPYCFCESEGRRACEGCLEKKYWVLPVLSALELLGPVNTFVNMLSRAPYLAKTGASLMAVQYAKRGWQIPDYIMPLTTLYGRLSGDHGAYLLAKELSKILHVPVTHSFRKAADKVVLLVDDILDRDGRAFNISEKLFTHHVWQTYALTLAV